MDLYFLDYFPGDIYGDKKMTIDLCFSGWLRGAEITYVTDVSDSKSIRELSVFDVEDSPHKVLVVDEHCPDEECRSNENHVKENISRDEFLLRLKDGRYMVSLSDLLSGDCHKSEIDLFDFGRGT